MATGSAVLKRFFDDQQLTDMWRPLVSTDPADTAFDGATASLRVMKTADGTNFKLRIKGVDPVVADRQFGSHLHVGPCSDGSDTTGGHFQHVQGAGATPENEVWFDVIPNDIGGATASTFVEFKPEDRLGQGKMSIVIHALPTNPLDGKAGTKETCLPLEVGDLW